MQVKRVILLSLGLIALSVVSGCATTPQQFNDKDVHFKMVGHQPMSSMSGSELYTIQVKSTSPLELTHLTMYLSYPIKTAPLVLEGFLTYARSFAGFHHFSFLDN